MKKPFWKSKTLWMNVITLGVAATSGQLPGVTIPPDAALAANAALNVLLRLITKDQLTTTAPSS